MAEPQKLVEICTGFAEMVDVIEGTCLNGGGAVSKSGCSRRESRSWEVNMRSHMAAGGIPELQVGLGDGMCSKPSGSARDLPQPPRNAPSHDSHETPLRGRHITTVQTNSVAGIKQPCGLEIFSSPLPSVRPPLPLQVLPPIPNANIVSDLSLYINRREYLSTYSRGDR